MLEVRFRVSTSRSPTATCQGSCWQVVLLRRDARALATFSYGPSGTRLKAAHRSGEQVLDSVGLVLRSELRRRWRSWLVIALLISVVGGFVLAAAAAARRTEGAFPALVATYGFDATVYATQPVPRLDHLPGVVSAVGLVSSSNGVPTCACSHPINPYNLTVVAEPAAGRPIFKLVAGHDPNPSDPDEVLASSTLQQDDGVRVGTVIHMPFFSRAQTSAANTATGNGLKPLGPNVPLHVVGLVAAPLDFPSGQVPAYELYTDPAFTRIVIPHIATGFIYAVWLRGGTTGLARFDVEANGLDRAGVEGVGNTNGEFQAIEASIRPQAIGWLILAILAALVGLWVVVQALVRQSDVESADYPTLRAIGASHRQLFLIGMTRSAILGLLGTLGAVVLALGLSPLAPVGEARLAETSTGIRFDPLVLVPGALATLLVVLALAIWPSARAAAPPRTSDRREVVHPSTAITRLAALGGPPSMIVGVRNAAQRRASGTTVPVGSAFLGTVLAVFVLCATVVFGASLTHLTSTPALYGDAYQLTIAVVPGLPDPALLTTVDQDNRFQAVARAVTEQVSIDHTTVGALAVDAVRGPVPLVTAEGHVPDSDGQIGLGAATMRQVGAHLGSVVRVSVTSPAGVTSTRRFRVVGEVPLPVVGGFVGLGNGALFTISGYEAAACTSQLGRQACDQAVEGGSFGAIVTKTVPGAPGRAAVAHYLASDPFYASAPVTPTSLVNFGEAINFPLIFGAIVALFGALTLAHLLVVSVARRRRETQLLKVLGFTNLQVISTVCWQATTLTVVGLVIGVPLGVIAGRLTWDLFAGQLGVVAVSVVPIWGMAALAGGVIVMANLLAIGPAAAAARIKTGRLLQTR